MKEEEAILTSLLNIIEHHEPFAVVTFFLLIILLICMYILIIGTKYIIKYNNNLKNIQQATPQTQVIDPILVSHNIKYDETSLITFYTEMNTMLRKSFKNTMADIKAKRIGMYLFHNGTRSINGIPFLKMSCVCEYIDRRSDVLPVMQEHTNLPVNFINELLHDLYHKQYFIIHAGDVGYIDKFVDKLFLNKADRNTCIFVTILDKKSIDEIPIGFIVAEFSEKEFTEEEKKHKIQIVKKLADESSYVLQMAKFYKNIDLLK